MNKKIQYIIIAFLVFSFSLAIICVTGLKPADITATYTRNQLAWQKADVLEDGAIKLPPSAEKMTVRLQNEVEGDVGYYIYLYTEKENTAACALSAKGITEISEKEYPRSLEKYDVKGAYRGLLAGRSKKNFTIKSDGKEEVRFLIIIEDNNSYPKEESPTLANVKFNAEVLLDGQYPRGEAYSFSLKEETGAVIETVHNEDGYISFSNIALKQKGTTVYYLSQNEGEEAGIHYDNSIYTIKAAVEEKNIVRVSYEKDGMPIETLPRFSNYTENAESLPVGNVAEYPTNAKIAGGRPNYLLLSAVTIGALLLIFYILTGKKRG